MAEEQLFVKEPEFFKKINDLNDRNVVVDKNENNTNARTFCACEQQASSSDSLNEFNNRHCNLTDSTEQCTGSQSSSGKNMQYESCYQSVIKRRSVHFSNQINKRSISDNDDLVDFQPLAYSDNVTNTETEASDTFRNGWTTERAYNTCFDSISKALKDDLYKDYVVVPVEKFIEACVKDIELAGDTTFLTDTINAMVTSIMTELVKTEELYTTKSSDGSQTLLEYFASGLCLNNCSDHGICESGVCRCNNGYIGEDCSYNTSYPPTEISFPFYGLCKLRTRACKATNVFGEFHSTFIWGKRRHFQILQNDLLETPDEDIVLAEYRNSFMVTIDLPTSEKKRSTESKVIAEGYDISFSYDDQTFGKEISLIIYDDLQYSCNATTKTCISLIAEDSSQEVDNKKNIIMIVVPATVSVVVIILIIGIICFKMMVKSSKSKIAAYRDEPDQKTTTCISENCMERENTVSELDFHFVENRVVDVFAMHYPQQKDHVNVWNGGFKTSK